jgi:ribosomal protein S25
MDGSEYGSGNLMIPYGKTGSGHAGNGTSRDRQEIQDASGLTGKRQKATLEAVELSAQRGVTAAEMEELLNVGHGQASSALSHLHRAGHIRRIKERRNKQEIYVTPENVGERVESPYNPRPERKHPKFHSDRTVVEAMKMAELPVDEGTYAKVRKMLENLP